MEIPTLLRLKHKDVGALIVFCLIGWLVGNAISDPVWAAYTAFLVCDHLFLGWLVFLGASRARHPIPIEILIVIHSAFVVLVLVVVAYRDSLHYFSWFPYPMTAMALWLLSCAVGYEKNGPEPVGLRRVRATDRAPQDQRLKKPVWTRPATRATRPATGSRPEQSEPPVVAPIIPESAIFKTAIQVTDSATASVPPPTQPAPSSVQPQPAEGATQPATAIREVLTVTESPILGYRSLVSGIALNLQPSLKPTWPGREPELYRDNSIAADLRQTYSEDVAKFYPTLVATAEDNEAWLDARGKENPTHRKLGMSVREEYEEWLTARLLARAAQNAASQASPIASSYGGGEGQPQQIQA
jgi:hypothetical protein